MQFGTADAIDLGAAFRAGAENDSGAALVETSSGILDLTLCLTFYTISFHLLPPSLIWIFTELKATPLFTVHQNITLIVSYNMSIHDVKKKSRALR